MIRFLIAYVLLIAFFVGAWILEGGIPLQVFEPTSFLLVIGVPFFGVLSVWKYRVWGRALSFAFTTIPTASETQKAVALWLFWERLSYIGGILGFLAGLILIATYLPTKDSVFDVKAFGEALGKSMMPLIVGVFLGVLGRILKTRVEENAGKDPVEPNQTGGSKR